MTDNVIYLPKTRTTTIHTRYVSPSALGFYTPTAAAYSSELGYSVHIVPTLGGFDWGLESNGRVDEADVANDLASIALSLRPPPRTFLERLKALFVGDEN